MKSRILIATLWLLIPLGIVAYHYGPGQEHLALDHTEDHLEVAREAMKKEDWGVAIEALSLIHISEPTRLRRISRMPSSA